MRWPWRVVAPLTPLAPVRKCSAEDVDTSYRCTLRLNHGGGDHETWISARFVHRWPR